KPFARARPSIDALRTESKVCGTALTRSIRISGSPDPSASGDDLSSIMRVLLRFLTVGPLFRGVVESRNQLDLDNPFIGVDSTDELFDGREEPFVVILTDLQDGMSGSPEDADDATELSSILIDDLESDQLRRSKGIAVEDALTGEE